MSNKLICELCGTELPEAGGECPNCSKLRTPVRVGADSDSKQSATRKVKYCSQCGTLLPQPGSPCPNCSVALAVTLKNEGQAESVAPKPEERTCPKCGGLGKINPEAGVCEECMLRSVVFSGSTNEAPTILTPAETQVYLEQGLFVGGKRFRLVQPLGNGGMGVVWLAEDQHLSASDRNIWVALKFLAPHIQRNPQALEMMREEVLQCRRLRHHHIINIYDWHADVSHLPFISMEYVEGVTLSDLRRKQPGRVLPWQLLGSLAEQICEALDYAHTVEGIVHRDLKPSNVMVDSRGKVRLADFGMASHAAADMQAGAANFTHGGTLQFMSPQQFHGCPPTPADDIYSFGATLYCLLTGTPPFYQGDIGAQLIGAQPQPIPERLAQLGLQNTVPAKLLVLIGRCLDKTPQNRPTAREILNLLPRMPHSTPVDPNPIVQPVAQTQELEEPESGGIRWGFIFSLLAFIIFLGGGGWYFVNSKKENPNERQSPAVSNKDESQSPQTEAPPQPVVNSNPGTLNITAQTDGRTGIALSNRILYASTKVIFQDWQLFWSNNVERANEYTGEPKTVPAGSYIVEMQYSKSGEPNVVQSANVLVPNGANLALKFGFQYRWVKIQSIPPGATVSYPNFGFQVMDKTPTTERQWIPGRRYLHLELEGFPGIDTNVVIEPGKGTATLVFQMNPTPAKTGIWNRSTIEDPAHFQFVYMDPFWAGVYEVTSNQFAKFVNDTPYVTTNGVYGITSNGAHLFPECSWDQPPFTVEKPGDYPVVGVNWYDAQAFCNWLTRKDREAGVLASNQLYTLPTSAEFSKMASGFTGGAGKGNYAGEEVRQGLFRRWHWSWDVLKYPNGASHVDDYPRIAPVGSNSEWKTPSGLYDLGGNVAEWCSDWYATNLNSTSTLARIPFLRDDGGGHTCKAVRGASWYEEQSDDVDISTVSRCDPKERNDRVGFRLVIKQSP